MYRIIVLGACIGLISCASPFPQKGAINKAECIAFEPIVYNINRDTEYTIKQIEKHNINWLNKCGVK